MLYPEIVAGTPATIVLHTDTRAAVVIRRTEKRVYVARVETGPTYRESENLAAGELPVMLADGLTDKPLGEGESYSFFPNATGGPVATRGDRSVRVVFGHSRTRIDYRY